jgi:hypothetical protein
MILQMKIHAKIHLCYVLNATQMSSFSLSLNASSVMFSLTSSASEGEPPGMGCVRGAAGEYMMVMCDRREMADSGLGGWK